MYLTCNNRPYQDMLREGTYFQLWRQNSQRCDTDPVLLSPYAA